MSNNKKYFAEGNRLSDAITMNQILNLYADKIIDEKQIHRVLDLVLQEINEEDS